MDAGENIARKYPPIRVSRNSSSLPALPLIHCVLEKPLSVRTGSTMCRADALWVGTLERVTQTAPQVRRG